jgi:hypothetical protein
MADEPSFVSPGMLIVRTLSDDALIHAVSEAARLGIEQFGVPQR